jgi:hypothetical protein
LIVPFAWGEWIKPRQLLSLQRFDTSLFRIRIKSVTPTPDCSLVS